MSSRASAEVAPEGLIVQFRRNLSAYLAGTLLLFALQALMWARDHLLRRGVDAALASDARGTTKIVAVIFAVVIAAAVIRVLSRMAIFHAGRMAEYQLRAILLDRMHTLGAAFFQRMPTGDLMSRATNDLGQVRLLLGFGVLNVVNTAFALVSALSVMAGISGRLTIAALVPLPLLLLTMRSFSRSLFLRTRENQTSLGAMSERVQGSLAGVRVVRAFSLEQSEQKAFEASSEDYLQKSLGLARLRGFFGPVISTTSAIGMLIVFWYGGQLVIDGVMSRGEFVAFWAALSRLTWPIIALGFVVSIIQRGRAGYARIAEILQAKPDVVDGDVAEPEHVLGRLEVKNLAYAFGDRKVLIDVSLRVAAGRSLAIVGRVGSGKSTLATLLARILPTPRGSVLLDDKDVCDLPLRVVRRSIGYAQQDAFLFSTTVARNIAFSLDDPDSEASLEATATAAREAQIFDEILELPDGMDSVVGERGLQLSGGQRQRVALARALAYEPKILILDDPLSAVDARTEKAILAAIERQTHRRTVILITSRIAAAAKCDSVVVLDRGRVIQEGTHEELLRSDGLYARFAEQQRLQREIESIDSDTRGAQS